MNINTNISIEEELSDADLVVASLGGDCQAFGKIVARYQRLICSLAYSSLGGLSESEDVAQETFVEAWKKLASLREPEKLKSWLCGILKFKISRHRRKEARQPVRQAGELHELDLLESNDLATADATMKSEEQALLWKALETVPKTYRETLILYYREHRSIEHVAFELELSEDAVKQRLSRGRKLLQERMMNFVEGALEQSSPGPVFTHAVMTAIIGIAPPVKAAGAGVTAAKVGSTVKWATIAAVLASVSGLISSFFAVRTNLAQSRTRRERKAVIKSTVTFLGSSLAFVAGMFGLRQLALGTQTNLGFYAILAQVSVMVFVVVFLIMTCRLLTSGRNLRTAERLRRPELFTSPDDQLGSKKREYKSRLTLFGVPLVHAKFSMPEKGEPPAFGWIAAGDKAYGLLLAWGGIAIAPISVGIVSFGLVTVGAVGIGLIGIGTVGIGWLAMGASAMGYKAYASLSSLGWESAFSQGFSVAKEAAIGPVALAEEVNNELAASISNLSMADESHAFILSAIAIMVIVPAVWHSRVVRGRGTGK